MKNCIRLVLLILLPVSFSLLACGNNEGQNLILKANNEWIKGKNHSAVEQFKAILKKYPSDQFAEEALFRLGEIFHFSLNNSKQAITYFQEVKKLNKGGVFGFDAQKYIAEIMEFTFKDYDQAIIEYQHLINEFDQPMKHADHQYRIASIYIKKQNYNQALAEFEILLEKYSESIRVEKVHFKIIETLYTLNRCSDVQDYFKHFFEIFPGSKYLDEINFILASCLEEKGKLREAYSKFKLLKNNYIYPILLEMKMESLEKRIKKK